MAEGLAQQELVLCDPRLEALNPSELVSTSRSPVRPVADLDEAGVLTSRLRILLTEVR